MTTRHVLSRLRLILVALPVLLAAARLSAEERADESLHVDAAALVTAQNDERWQALLHKLTALQTVAERECGKLPYHDITVMASITKYGKLPDAKPGLHSRWSEARFLSEIPPGPGETYIHTALAILNGDLVPTTPRNIERRPDRNNKELWDGYINKSVLVINGSGRTSSYIYNSIVVIGGDLQIDGYIYNSLVICTNRGGSRTLKVEGYITNSLIIAPHVDCSRGYVSDSILYTKLKCDSLRGAQVRDYEPIAKKIVEICNPQ